MSKIVLILMIIVSCTITESVLGMMMQDRFQDKQMKFHKNRLQPTRMRLNSQSTFTYPVDGQSPLEKLQNKNINQDQLDSNLDQQDSNLNDQSLNPELQDNENEPILKLNQQGLNQNNQNKISNRMSLKLNKKNPNLNKQNLNQNDLNPNLDQQDSNLNDQSLNPEQQDTNLNQQLSKLNRQRLNPNNQGQISNRMNLKLNKKNPNLNKQTLDQNRSEQNQEDEQELNSNQQDLIISPKLNKKKPELNKQILNEDQDQQKLNPEEQELIMNQQNLNQNRKNMKSNRKNQILNNQNLNSDQQDPQTFENDNIKPVATRSMQKSKKKIEKIEVDPKYDDLLTSLKNHEDNREYSINNIKKLNPKKVNLEENEEREYNEDDLNVNVEIKPKKKTTEGIKNLRNKNQNNDRLYDKLVGLIQDDGNKEQNTKKNQKIKTTTTTIPTQITTTDSPSTISEAISKKKNEQDSNVLKSSKDKKAKIPSRGKKVEEDGEEEKEKQALEECDLSFIKSIGSSKKTSDRVDCACKTEKRKVDKIEACLASRSMPNDMTRSQYRRKNLQRTCQVLDDSELSKKIVTACDAVIECEMQNCSGIWFNNNAFKLYACDDEMPVDFIRTFSNNNIVITLGSC